MILKHIKQQTEFDCGFAVAAMLCDVDYDTACEWDANPNADRGVNGPELAELLWDILTEKEPSLEETHYPPRCTGVAGAVCPITKLVDASVIDFTVSGIDWHSRGVALLIIRPSKQGDCHWIAVQGQMVYDPELDEPVNVNDYGHSHWIVLAHASAWMAGKGVGKGTGKRNGKK